VKVVELGSFRQGCYDRARRKPSTKWVVGYYGKALVGELSLMRKDTEAGSGRVPAFLRMEGVVAKFVVAILHDLRLESLANICIMIQVDDN
jgi:hypothetical protein